jgi:hypothetical protein
MQPISLLYKIRQSEIVEEMKRHEVADLNFHSTANMVLKLAVIARELFENSEVEEKRQLLNLASQNLPPKDISLSLQVDELFKITMDYKNCPREWGRLDSNQRRPKSRDLQSLAIATMRHPLSYMLEKGIEPSTIRLQVGRSTS